MHLAVRRHDALVTTDRCRHWIDATNLNSGSDVTSATKSNSVSGSDVSDVWVSLTFGRVGGGPLVVVFSFSPDE